MSTPTSNKEQLFVSLILDEIQANEETLNKAKNGDGASLGEIGYIYYTKGVYLKVMSWYHLGNSSNHADSQHRLGYMYTTGEGVSVDYGLAKKVLF